MKTHKKYLLFCLLILLASLNINKINGITPKQRAIAAIGRTTQAVRSAIGSKPNVVARLMKKINNRLDSLLDALKSGKKAELARIAAQAERERDEALAQLARGEQIIEEELAATTPTFDPEQAAEIRGILKGFNRDLKLDYATNFTPAVNYLTELIDSKPDFFNVPLNTTTYLNVINTLTSLIRDQKENLMNLTEESAQQTDFKTKSKTFAQLLLTINKKTWSKITKQKRAKIVIAYFLYSDKKNELKFDISGKPITQLSLSRPQIDAIYKWVSGDFVNNKQLITLDDNWGSRRRNTTYDNLKEKYQQAYNTLKSEANRAVKTEWVKYVNGYLARPAGMNSYKFTPAMLGRIYVISALPDRIEKIERPKRLMINTLLDEIYGLNVPAELQEEFLFPALKRLVDFGALLSFSNKDPFVPNTKKLILTLPGDPTNTTVINEFSKRIKHISNFVINTSKEQLPENYKNLFKENYKIFLSDLSSANGISLHYLATMINNPNIGIIAQIDKAAAKEQ